MHPWFRDVMVPDYGEVRYGVLFEDLCFPHDFGDVVVFGEVDGVVDVVFK